jgi:hypothetical protein
VLAESLAAQRAHFDRDRDAARQLIAIGATVADPALDPCELAAYTTIASVLLNLDETLTKE